MRRRSAGDPIPLDEQFDEEAAELQEIIRGELTQINDLARRLKDEERND